MKPAFALALALALASPAAAAPPSARRVGPFSLGMTLAQVKAAAAQAGLVAPRLGAPHERDVMGLALMEVQPFEAESREATPAQGRLWAVQGYLVSGRLALLEVDYGQEDPARTRAWFEAYDVPSEIRKHPVDTTWSSPDGVVLHADPLGRTFTILDWAGLRSGNRALVDLDGAVRVANEYYRRLRAKEAEASLEVIRQRVAAWYAREADGGRACKPPPSVEDTPGESACDQPDHRFPLDAAPWGTETWRSLGVGPKDVSRWYSYSIESDGELNSARVVLVARGDQDCNGQVSTFRVVLRADPRASRHECSLDEGQWEAIDPLE